MEKVQKIKENLENAKKFIELLKRSPSTYHVVETSIKELKSKGFVELKENCSWDKLIKTGGCYFVVRNFSSIFAFTVGGKFQPGNGCKIVGAHTDSPHLRVRPISNDEKDGHDILGVTTYGGGIWRTWFDREFSIAGKVIVETKEGLETKLVDLKRPLVIIPSLAIHLDRSKNFTFSKEANLAPVLSSVAASELKGSSDTHKQLLELIAEELSLNSIEQIKGFELSLVDCCPPKLGGLYNDMIHSHGLDNKFSCLTGLVGLLDSITTLENDEYVRMLAMFDHEEIGSTSRCGAQNLVLVDVIKRLCKCLKTEKTPKDYMFRTIAKSFLVSADNAHAVHPNYSSHHHPKYKPLMEKNEIPYSLFQVKNDSRCGTTIGPVSSAKTGIRSVDIGCGQWAMHSIRETIGSLDVAIFEKFFKCFYESFEKFDNELN